MPNTETITETQTAPATAGVKTKNAKTGNLILDIAHEVEQMTKQKALSEAEKLAENVEVSYFKLGGVLKRINDQSWFEGHATFDAFVYESYGFQVRKARYLISIYDNLVTKQIPWEKVSHLGWTKLKDLAPVLTVENVDEWVAKAEKLTVADLYALLKPQTTEATDTTQKTSDGLVKMKFAFKQDQADIVSQALAKAKGELNTTFDTVAMENICSGYVGGNSTVHQPSVSFEAMVTDMGFEAALKKVSDLFPEYEISVDTAAPANG